MPLGSTTRKEAQMTATPTPRQLTTATAGQLKYLKSLAGWTGTSFVYPKDKAQASAEIQRLEQIWGGGRTFAERDTEVPESYARGGFNESTGYGSHASYDLHSPTGLGARSEPPMLTDEQEASIIDYQAIIGDQDVSETVVEAADYLDRAYAAPEDPASEKQLAYLHRLERGHGVSESHPTTKRAASRRIERLLNSAGSPAAS